MSKQIEHVQFVSICRKDEISFDIVAETGNIVAVFGNIVAKNGNNVEATFDTVERIVQLVAFDKVASTLLLVWTGLCTSLLSAATEGGIGHCRRSLISTIALF